MPGLAALNWQQYGTTGDYVAVVPCDFSQGDYLITPAGSLGVSSGSQVATGLVVDNINGNSSVTVTIGNLTLTVPPFMRDEFRMAGSSQAVKLSGASGSSVNAIFYFGAFHGNPVAQNVKQAVQSVATADPGTIIAFGGDPANKPSATLVCDGSAVNRVQYANLFSAIGTKWGAGDGVATFNLPNLHDDARTLVGASGAIKVGDKGGEQNHTLTVNELPPHHHDGGQLTVTPGGTGTSSSPASSTGGQGAKNTGDTGGGAAHNNMPPYAGVTWLIYY